MGCGGPNSRQASVLPPVCKQRSPHRLPWASFAPLWWPTTWGGGGVWGGVVVWCAGVVGGVGASCAGRGGARGPREDVPARPSLGVGWYRGIAWWEPYTHRGWQRNLLGADADKELVRSMSSEKQVSDKTPPTFLWHTSEDRGVPPENSVQFYLALKRAGVPAELHVFEKGRHGVGLARHIPGTWAWPARCADWLRVRGGPPTR